MHSKTLINMKSIVLRKKNSFESLRKKQISKSDRKCINYEYFNVVIYISNFKSYKPGENHLVEPGGYKLKMKKFHFIKVSQILWGFGLVLNHTKVSRILKTFSEMTGFWEAEQYFGVGEYSGGYKSPEKVRFECERDEYSGGLSSVIFWLLFRDNNFLFFEIFKTLKNFSSFNANMVHSLMALVTIGLMILVFPC